MTLAAVNDICRNTDLDVEVCDCAKHARAPKPVAPSEPGLYRGISDLTYHADRNSLSSSGARALLPPSCPALFKHEQDNLRPAKRVFDIGHAAHTLILGTGSPTFVLDPAIHGLKKDGDIAASPRATATWKAAEAEARERGEVPVHITDWRVIEAMAQAVKGHKLAGALFEDGEAELSGYWRDPATGVALRFRPDWSTWRGSRGDHLYLVDLKTTDDASPAEFARSVNKYRYHAQDAWYTAGAEALELADRVSFLFVAVSKKAPHLVSVCELDYEAKQLGHRLNRQAIETYARCIETNEWPDFGTGPHLISLPAWATRQIEEIDQ